MLSPRRSDGRAADRARPTGRRPGARRRPADRRARAARRRSAKVDDGAPDRRRRRLPAGGAAGRHAWSRSRSRPSTGRAALFSIPRNLERAPLVGAAGRAYGRFPDLLNALYRFAQSRPELFPGGRDPGATALKQTVSNLLGIPVHYYVIVDLRGFVEVVDALGGVRMTAPDSVNDLTSPAYPGRAVDGHRGRAGRGREARRPPRARLRALALGLERLHADGAAALHPRRHGRPGRLDAHGALRRPAVRRREGLRLDRHPSRAPSGSLVAFCAASTRTGRSRSASRRRSTASSSPTSSEYRATVKRLLTFKLDKLRASGLRVVAGLCPGRPRLRRGDRPRPCRGFPLRARAGAAGAGGVHAAGQGGRRRVPRHGSPSARSGCWGWRPRAPGSSCRPSRSAWEAW